MIGCQDEGQVKVKCTPIIDQVTGYRIPHTQRGNIHSFLYQSHKQHCFTEAHHEPDIERGLEDIQKGKVGMKTWTF